MTVLEQWEIIDFLKESVGTQVNMLLGSPVSVIKLHVLYCVSSKLGVANSVHSHLGRKPPPPHLSLALEVGFQKMTKQMGRRAFCIESRTLLSKHKMVYLLNLVYIQA